MRVSARFFTASCAYSLIARGTWLRSMLYRVPSKRARQSSGRGSSSCSGALVEQHRQIVVCNHLQCHFGFVCQCRDVRRAHCWLGVELLKAAGGPHRGWCLCAQVSVWQFSRSRTTCSLLLYQQPMEEHVCQRCVAAMSQEVVPEHVSAPQHSHTPCPGMRRHNPYAACDVYTN